MSENSVNNKRIAKNTIILFLRMIFVMGVSLYLSRLVLSALGTVDYGIYNIIGGVVVLFTFINSAMTTAVQRFLNFELGRGDDDAVKKVFGIGLNIHIMVAILIFVLSQTVGLWFLNNKLNIPEGRMAAANIVFQFSTIATCLNILLIPFNAAVIAHEKMSFFAYISIAETMIKLAIAIIISQIATDRLSAYAILLTVVPLVSLVSYVVYCRRNFNTCRFSLEWDPVRYKEILSFSGWSLFGSAASMSANQGVNILLNIFYGVTVNAAVGIANQVNAAVNALVANFQTAFRPQIVKSYANNDFVYLGKLVESTSKYSFLLLFAIAFPLMINMEFVLNMWLESPPLYAYDFAQMILIYSLIEAFSGPLWMLVQASGNIKKYQIIISSFIALNLLGSWAMLKMGQTPEVVYYVRIALAVCYLIVRLFFLKRILGESIMRFVKNAIVPSLLVALVSFVSVCIATDNLTGLTRLGVTLGVFFPLYAFVIYTFILSKADREKVIGLVNKK